MDFITEGIESKNVEFAPKENPQDQNIVNELKKLKLPQVNAYVPEDLSMKSLCEY